MSVSEVAEVAVYVNHEFATAQWNCIVRLVLLPHSFREQPIQDRKVSVDWGDVDAVVTKLPIVDSVLKLVELDESIV